MEKPFSIRGFINTWEDSWADDGFHSHPTLEIEMILEGAGVFEWQGSKCSIEAGQIVVLPPNTPHRFEGRQRNRYGVIHMEQVPERLLELLRQMMPQGNPGMIALSRLDKERFEKLFREWLQMTSSMLREKERNDLAWMEVMLLFLLEKSQGGRQTISMAKAADYMRENLHKPFQIADLAVLAGMAESGFRRLFEQIYHMSPKKYHHLCRMAEAKWLLSSTDQEIREIAGKVGFHRLHSFSQWFKKQEGIAPSEFRNRQRLNESFNDEPVA